MTPNLLSDYGFIYQKHSGIGGQDQWAGLDSWYHKQELNLVLRGSTQKGKIGHLMLYPFFNSIIDTEQDLKDILRLAGVK